MEIAVYIEDFYNIEICDHIKIVYTQIEIVLHTELRPFIWNCTQITICIYRNYINAVQSFSKNMRNTFKPENTKLINAANANTYIDGGVNYGVGVALDTISNSGVDYSSTNFGINMTMDLVTDFPQSVYLFVHSKNVLVFNQSGLQVSR